MNISKNQNNNILIALISFLLFVCIFKWINYLVTNNYVKLTRQAFVEGFDSNTQAIRDTGSPDTSHNVDMPLTTTTNCKNMCGPPNRCSITGQQCFSDIDCPGCEPQVPPLSPSTGENIIGNDDSGKLTAGVTPNYSPLTTGFGTQARIVTEDKFEKPDMPDFGIDKWSSKFIKGRKLFDDRYKPSGLKNMPSYPDRYSLTGEFVDEGPLPSNAYLR
jgi:hypothetical protein